MAQTQSEFLGQLALRRATAPSPAVVIEPGDQVRVWRGWYWHHAVSVSNGWLIEFGSSVRGGRVAYVAWSAFARGRAVEFVRRGGRLAVDRAMSRLDRGGFRVLSANCEHFATWCTTGRWESPQVEAAALLLVAGTALLCLSKVR
jgi:hypothetical protein